MKQVGSHEKIKWNARQNVEQRCRACWRTEFVELASVGWNVANGRVGGGRAPVVTSCSAVVVYGVPCK